ncbi:MAG: DUF1223 domain-containing protein [Alphaproteobacteria bacterium]
MKKFLWLIFLSSLPFYSAKAQDDLSPVVLELFTSQSCSSCPPADKILGELADENDNIIDLSCNVTYWNHLHWEDTLSKDFCTQRQRQYVQHLRSRGPYTPQIVINGKYEMVGSRESAIKKTIKKDLKDSPIKLITLNLSEQQLDIKLPETPGSDSYAVSLLAHGKRHTQSIPSGENKGRTVNYTNPVERIISLGTWDGTGKTMTYDVSELPPAQGYVVLAQKNSVVGEIIAAGKINP